MVLNPTVARSAAATVPAARRAGRPGSTGRRCTRTSRAFAFIGPFYLVFLFAVVVPTGYALYLSLFQLRHVGFGPAVNVFSGLANYTRVLADPAFRGGFLVLALFCVVGMPLIFAIAVGLALLLDSALARAKRLLQVGLFMPHAVPGLIAALVWLYLYTPGVSPVISLLGHVGVHYSILNTPGAVIAIVNLMLWEGTGFTTIVFFVALQAIPRELVEAARLDGAGEARIALGVKLPLISGMVGVLGIFQIIGLLSLFVEPQFLSSATPAISPSWTPMMYVYNLAYTRLDYGAAAAASILLALFIGTVSYLAMRFVSKRRLA